MQEDLSAAELVRPLLAEPGGGGVAECAQDAGLRDHLIAAVEMVSLERDPFCHSYMEGLIQAASSRIPTLNKIVTRQFYLPESESQLDLGTSLFLRHRGLFGTSFRPNSAFAFPVSDPAKRGSWHGRKS